MKTLYTQTSGIKRVKRAGAAIALMLLPGLAQAQTTILAWSLRGAAGNEATYNATATDAHLATATLSRVNAPVVTTPQVFTFMSTNFNQTAKGDQGFVFNITPSATYQVSLSSLSYKLRNSASIPPGSFRWQYSLDGTNFTDIGASDIAMPASSLNGTVQAPIDLSGVAALQNVATPITMRLVAWNLSSTTAMFGFGRSLATATDSIVLAVTGTVVPSTPQPITLQSFQAIADQTDADLSWATAMEKNSSHFNVERSANGKDFSYIGEVASKNSATGARYNYTDNGALSNSDHQYYRLQSVDKDGSATYSAIAKVTAHNAVSSGLIVYPNPATSAVTIESNLGESGLLQVFNATGQLVLEQKLGKAYQKTELNTASFTRGVYLIRLRGGQQTDARQLIIR